MGKTFRDIHVCHTNDFDPKKNDKIKGWVEFNGGLFSRDLSSDVTHLIASPRAWKRKVPLVEAAMKRQDVKIVKLDWLEASLLSASKKPLRTIPYEFYPRAAKLSERPASGSSWRRHAPTGTGIREKDRSREIARTGLRFDQECQSFVDDKAKNGYFPYNANGVSHVVYFLRNDIAKDRLEQLRLKVRYWSSPSHCSTYSHTACSVTFLPNFYTYHSARIPATIFNQGARPRVPLVNTWAQCLQMFQTDAQPPQYACYTLYSSPFGHADHGTVAPQGSTFEFAIEAFRKYFKNKTGSDWRKENGARLSDPSVTNMLIDGSHDNHYIHVASEVKSASISAANDRSSFTTCLSRSVAAAEELKAQAPTPESGW